MTLVPITARVSQNDKIQFDSFCDSVGLNASVTINMFIKAVLKNKKIPFEISEPDPFYSDYNQKILLESVLQLKNGGGTKHELIED